MKKSPHKIKVFPALVSIGGYSFLVMTLVLQSLGIHAQSEEAREIAKIVYLDSIVVQASKSDFSVQDFIDMVQKDVSFYLAFRNLRASSYDFNTSMIFRGRKERDKASYQSLHRQYIVGGCRFQVALQEKVSGNLFRKRKKKQNYYTYTLFDRLFLTQDTICGVEVRDQEINFEGKGIDGHVGELKKLIFAPGVKSDIPFIGNKMEIFSDRMRPRYDFFIHSKRYNGDVDAYAFEVRLKPEFGPLGNNRTVIKKLITYFSKTDFQVLSRSYQLAHYKAFYSFNVKMEIDLCKKGGLYFPSKIHYDGFWNVPTKKKETSTFSITFENHQVY